MQFFKTLYISYKTECLTDLYETLRNEDFSYFVKIFLSLLIPEVYSICNSYELFLVGTLNQYNNLLFVQMSEMHYRRFHNCKGLPNFSYLKWNEMFQYPLKIVMY